MLNQRQTVFVQEYLQSGNATQAAIRAGYSEDTAYSIGWENLRKPEIQQAIKDFQKAMTEKTEITIESIVRQINDIATDASLSAKDRLKGYDMLLRHLGGYFTINDIIERLTPEQLEELSTKILTKMDSYEKR